MGNRVWMLVPLLVLAIACGHKNGKTADAPAGADDAPLGVDAPICKMLGDACGGNADCCTNVCNAQGKCDFMHTCGATSATCTTGVDCCSYACVGSACAATCTNDGATCASDGQCCSGKCSGTCQPLNPSCKTGGNTCTANTECCSGLCTSAGTCGNASYCVQNGDVCATDGECCGGICTIAAGHTLGTCSQPQTGATNCSAGVDGSLCSGCGDCCSRLCELYPPTGVKICQPAEGCHIDGDICHKSGDCCGAAGTGLPGAGNVICLGEGGCEVGATNCTDTVGVCRNPNGCDPEGDVCHYQNYATCGNSSARNDCCGGLGNSGVCQLDALGVPRCYGLSACVDSGQQCAFSGDCCNGVPCLPNGAGGYVCGQNACQMTSQICTNSSDCCNGLTCVYQPGQTAGTCGGTTVSCSQDGQSCNDMTPCCNGLTCNVSGTTNACPPGMETGCSCFAPLF
jgi:hypothetical protein